MSKTVGLQAVWELVKELRGEAQEERFLVVGGAKELAAVLRRELTRGGVVAAVHEQGPLDGGAALVYVVAGKLDGDDERALREASRAKLALVAVVTGPAAASPREIPYVLAEDVLQVAPGAGFPVDDIGRALARRLGDRATALAARLPVLRHAVCEELIERYARRNALVGAAVFLPGADLPILTLNQVRLVLRIADAHGFELDRERLPEVLAVVGGGLGFRSIARRAVGLVPLVGWAIKGGVAYTGTRALGEAAVRYFERRAPVTRVPGDRARFP